MAGSFACGSGRSRYLRTPGANPRTRAVSQPFHLVWSAGPVGEGADRVGAPLDLAVEPLEAVGGTDPMPVSLGEQVELGGRFEAAVEARHRLRELAPEADGELGHPLASLGLGGRQE